MPSENAKIISLLFEVGRKIRDVAHAAHASKKKGETCSLLHFQTLRYVEEHGKPFMNEVADYLRVTPSAATLLIDGLVKEKLLARTVDAKDRRAVRLSVTERGKKLLAKGMHTHAAAVQELMATFTPKERTQFVSLLEKISHEK